MKSLGEKLRYLWSVEHYERIVACNFIFLIYYLTLPSLLRIPDSIGGRTFLIYFLHSLTTNAILFIIPGISFLTLLNKQYARMTVLFMWTFVYSLLAHFLVFLVCLNSAIFPIEKSAFIFIVIISNIFLIIGTVRQYHPLSVPLRSGLHVLKLFFIIYTCIFTFSLYFESIKCDHDVPAAHAAYPMVHFMKPYGGETLEATYFLTRPFLFVFIPACSFLYSDAMDEIKPFYDCVVPAVERRVQIFHVSETDDVFQAFFEEWKSTMTMFTRSKKLLMITRIPFIFLASLVLLYLFFLLKALFKSRLITYGGLIIALIQPEVMLRASCASSEMMALFFIVVLLYMRYVEEYNGRLLFIVSAVGMLCNQEMIFFPLSLVVVHVLESVIPGPYSFYERVKRMCVRIGTDKIIMGCVIGSVLVVLYSALMSYEIFTKILLPQYALDPLGEIFSFHKGFQYNYERIFALLRYNANTGFILMPLAAISALSILFSRKTMPLLKVMAVCFFIILVFFYVSGTEFTKHYFFTLIPMMVLLGACFHWCIKRSRLLAVVCGCVLCFIVVRNVVLLHGVCRDPDHVRLHFGISF